MNMFIQTKDMGGLHANKTTGRLIDREVTLKQRLNQQQSKCL